jgi:hypothetical protein
LKPFLLDIRVGTTHTYFILFLADSRKSLINNKRL